MSQTVLRSMGFLLVVLVILSGAALWTVSNTQVFKPAPTAAPARSQPFAIAEISKPTYTPQPPPTATSTPEALLSAVEVPTNTAVSVAEAVIVEAAQPSENNFAVQAPVNYSGGKYILVDISDQHMYVYEGEYLIYSFVASTGMNNATRTGSFSVLDKIPNAYGATWDLWMPNWLGIYWASSLENGIHALPILSNGATLWAGFLGSPISYGCVVLGTYDSQLLYDWAEVGVPVEIQW